MKTKFFTKLALVIVIVAAVTSSTFGQRWNNANRFANNQVASAQPACINQISDLTEKQVEKITALEKQHQAKMEEFRTQRRSTPDAVGKDKIRVEMQTVVETHRKEVKSVLTADQQKQYDLLHTFANPNYARGRQFRGDGIANNQAFVRCPGKGNCAMANNRRFNRSASPRQVNVGAAGYGPGYGRNTAFGRGYCRGFNTIPTETIEDSKEN